MEIEGKLVEFIKEQTTVESEIVDSSHPKKSFRDLVKGETITEEERWDIIWRNAPFHGSPSG